MTMPLRESIAVQLKSRFPDFAFPAVEFRGETTVEVPRERIVEVCRFLRDEGGYDFLSDLCAVDRLHQTQHDPDWPPDAPRFEVVYHLYSLRHFTFLRLKVRVAEGEECVPTVTGVWSTADWHERETYDMMGIVFEGHPDLRRLLTAESVYDETTQRWKPFEGHPLRKDFDLDYQPVDFTVQEIDRSLRPTN